ncbi:MAG: OmpA family protein [Campylobacterota bacterium]|nr:OmpA family protein [Campylobacterota bacterium]
MDFSKKGNTEEQNFWVSYADLMAGLLFIFILLIGSIVVKYVLVQTDLEALRSSLAKEQNALKMSNKDLANKKSALANLRSKLSKNQQERIAIEIEREKIEKELGKTKNALSEAENHLEYKTSQIAELLLNVGALEQASKEQLAKLTLNADEMKSLKNLIFDFESENSELKNSILTKDSELNKSNQELQDAQNKIANQEKAFKLTQEELAYLEKRLLIQVAEYQRVATDLNLTKAKIRNLTGIKIHVVSELKKALGDSINIDPNSGAIRFSSNILFTQGKYTLKDDSKKELKKILGKYIHTLFSNNDIRKNIESIVIEGHSNSDGDYMYNLGLSQRRALEVMKFLLSMKLDNTEELKQLVSASGKSYSNLIYKADGSEDKDASRRIEIKFSIKNDKGIKELEKFLKMK